MAKKVPSNMTACFELIESEMLQGPWVLGDVFSVCDAYLLAIARWLEADDVDTTNLTQVLDHRARMSELPAVKRALEVEQALLEE